MDTFTNWILGVGFSSIIYFYCTSQKCRYYVKFTVFTFAALVCASAYIPLMLFRPMNYRNALLPCWSLRQIGLLFGLTWEVRGRENIVNDSGSIVIVNHQSALDLLVMANIWRYLPNCSAIAKKEIFYMWPFGLAVWLWGTIFIDRLNSESAKNTISRVAETVVSRTAKLWMFPEGTRHGGEELLPFKKGAFFVAIQSQCPIQPIVVSRYYYVDHNKYTFGSGKNIISILPPIPTVGLKKEDLNTLMEKSYNTMNQKYIELSKEVIAKHGDN